MGKSIAERIFLQGLYLIREISNEINESTYKKVCYNMTKDDGNRRYKMYSLPLTNMYYAYKQSFKVCIQEGTDYS